MLSDETAVADLVFGGLVQFQALGQAFTTPAFDRLLVDKKPRISVGISLAGNLINLAGPPTTCPRPRWRRCWRATGGASASTV